MKIKKDNKKTYFKLAALTIGLSIAGVSFADNDMSAAVVSQLKNLNSNVQVVGNSMQAIAIANNKSNHGFEPDANINQSMTSNTAYQDGKNANEQTLASLSLGDIQSQLQPFSDKLLQTDSGMIDADAISTRLLNDELLKSKLSVGTRASDSVYSNNPTVLSLSLVYANDLPPGGLNKPTADENHDNYFDFGSLISPMSYNDGQYSEQAAQAYVTYLTKSYNDPGSTVADAFQNKLQQSKTDTDKVGLYKQLLSDPKYQDYQLTERSAVAARSVAVNNLEYLIAERTPVKGLGKKAGVTNSNGQPVNDASPLQVESYNANHRLKNPSWYGHVQSESQANVQRETLIVLSELQSQMFQAHMDRERMIGMMAAQSAMSSGMSSQLTASQAQQLKGDIAKFTLASDNDNKK